MLGTKFEPHGGHPAARCVHPHAARRLALPGRMSSFFGHFTSIDTYDVFVSFFSDGRQQFVVGQKKSTGDLRTNPKMVVRNEELGFQIPPFGTAIERQLLQGL